MNSLLRLVGEQLRLVRRARGLTQEELAEKCGLSFSYISDIERGSRNVTLESLDKIMTALDIMPSEVFNFKDIDSVNAADDKRMMVEILRSLLVERRPDEVRFILKMAQEFVQTVDSQRKMSSQ
ncbi:HTH-type transcriptional regulator SinR [Paenibacillus konkukensis]|uniref:HTH-type transcriptional regulator SinR n=1 Tax=Paenibacillus konkukensis TaxID=2020716 RepID=A0ABY4RPY1_9BACL|nr:helix-turn-helix domain-containing protein [Paenibacillus konkukensis]UQZ84561.1 HTH-type transcriptional regulator SinR [Paenibacillus konkukensis]